MAENKGFTLVEMSIVMIGVALVIGGIVLGSSLIRTTGLTRISTDIERYKTAVDNFKGKYKYYPGDLPLTSEFFSGTSNGNGNGRIDGSGSASYSSTFLGFNSVEHLTAWQHLALSGMITGAYTGTGVTVSPGINIPKTAFDTGITFATSLSRPYAMAVGTGDVDNDIFGYQREAFLTTSEAYAIDKKLDDGNPATGKVQASGGIYNKPCVNYSGGVYSYLFSYAAQNSCSIMFLP